VPALNEVANLERCLGSVTWADEVWVVDSSSTDGTGALAARLGARVAQFAPEGAWPKKKNWALENLPLRNDWVFILDADEVLPPEAEAEFRAIVSDPGNPHAGYWINRRFHFMGRVLRHAYAPNWNLRLFRHRLGRYERLTGADADPGIGDNEVHEHVIVQGSTTRLRCVMEHYAFPDVATFVEKHNRYSNWEARVAIAQSLRASGTRIQSGRVSWRRRLRTLALRLPCRPVLRFLYVYVLQRGFLDGREGYWFARLHGYYEFLCVVKTRELRGRDK